MEPDIVCEPMSRNDVILAVVCAVLVGFSLIVSLVVPRSRPDFPGRRVRLFVLVAALLVLAMLISVERLGAEEESPEAEAPAETQSGPAETQSAPTETSGGTSTGGETQGDPANGEKIFASAGCGGCHTLSAAGSSGTVGPNLDDLKPPYDKVVSQVTNGGGAMPAFKDKLSPEEIQDVAAYVVASTQR
jgi:mono/diheme cytochrome c family protein